MGRPAAERTRERERASLRDIGWDRHQISTMHDPPALLVLRANDPPALDALLVVPVWEPGRYQFPVPTERHGRPESLVVVLIPPGRNVVVGGWAMVKWRGGPAGW